MQSFFLMLISYLSLLEFHKRLNNIRDLNMNTTFISLLYTLTARTAKKKNIFFLSIFILFSSTNI